MPRTGGEVEFGEHGHPLVDKIVRRMYRRCASVSTKYAVSERSPPLTIRKITRTIVSRVWVGETTAHAGKIAVLVGKV